MSHLLVPLSCPLDVPLSRMTCLSFLVLEKKIICFENEFSPMPWIKNIKLALFEAVGRGTGRRGIVGGAQCLCQALRGECGFAGPSPPAGSEGALSPCVPE